MAVDSNDGTPISEVDWQGILDRYVLLNGKQHLATQEIMPSQDDFWATFNLVGDLYRFHEMTYDETCFLLLIIVEAVKTGDLK